MKMVKFGKVKSNMIKLKVIENDNFKLITTTLQKYSLVSKQKKYQLHTIIDINIKQFPYVLLILLNELFVLALLLFLPSFLSSGTLPSTI